MKIAEVLSGGSFLVRSEIGYEAVEFAIEYVSPQLYLCLLPTVHVSKLNGEKLSKQDYQYQINQRISTIYNQGYNEKLRYWEGLFRKNGVLHFEYKDMTVIFHSPATSCGGLNRRKEWNELNAYSFDEPIMCFSDSDEEKSSINQLRGLVKYGIGAETTDSIFQCISTIADIA